MNEAQPTAMKVLLRVLFVVPLLLFVGALFFFFAGLDPERDPSRVPTVREGKPAPEMALPPIPGVERPGLATADLASGAPQIVNVFASWCVPCKAEHPLITRLAEEEGLAVNGINYRDAAQAAASWLEELGNPYARIGFDSDGKAGLEWSITGVPETYLIDGAGQVVWHHQGPLTAQLLEEELRPRLEALQ